MNAFSVAARAHHRVVGKIALVLIILLYGLVCLLFHRPAWGLVLMIPIGVILAAIWLPVLLDHRGIRYEVDAHGVSLCRGGKQYKRIEAGRIKSVEQRGRTVIVRPKGLVGQPIFLHPESEAGSMVLAIQECLLNEES